MSDEFRGDGLDCKCEAWGYADCGCGADWTPKKQWEQARKISELEQKIAEARKVLEGCKNEITVECGCAWGNHPLNESEIEHEAIDMALDVLI